MQRETPILYKLFGGKNMSKKLFSVVSLLLLAALVLGACAQTTAVPTEEPAAQEVAATEEVVETEEVAEVEEAETEEAQAEEVTEAADIPLVVAYDIFSQKFSPFFADSGYDRDVSDMVQINLLTTDRSGGIIFNAH